MTTGLVIYLFATPTLPKDELRQTRGGAAPLDRTTWRPIGALLVLFVPVSLFWGIYEQQGNTIVLWASDYTDRHLFGWDIPVTWFQAFNPFMIFAFTPFIVTLWRRQGAQEPSTVAKMAIGCFLAASPILLWSPPRIYPAAGRQAGSGCSSISSFSPSANFICRRPACRW